MLQKITSLRASKRELEAFLSQDQRLTVALEKDLCTK